MFKHSIHKRVTYGETDRMGYLYYGHYAQYYEIARVEALRALGIRYRDMEDEDDVMLPVKSMEVKYVRPARYDERIRIDTILREMPKRSLIFDYELFNEKQQLINRATVTLVFVKKSTGRRCEITSALHSKLLPYFE